MYWDKGISNTAIQSEIIHERLLLVLSGIKFPNHEDSGYRQCRHTRRLGNRGCQTFTEEHLRGHQDGRRRPVLVISPQTRAYCIILRTSRFFPEEDDDELKRQKYSGENAKANEYLFRRVQLEDVVNAHIAAAGRASALGFGRYIISAKRPALGTEI